MIEIQPFKESYISDAVGLFVATYQEALDQLPTMPRRDDVAELTTRELSKIVGHAGFAAFDGPNLVGYMIEMFTNDAFMGKPTAFCIELFPCASKLDNREKIYQQLYKELSRSWIDRGFYAHQMNFLATDTVLANAFFRLGFGMTHFEFFRDLSVPAGEIPEVDIRYVSREESLYEIDKEHHAFYANPPLFWIRDSNYDECGADRVLAGEIEIIAAHVDDEIVAYFKLRKGTAEIDLFEHPGNGQIKGAYCRPAFRGKGIGKALLAKTVQWARRNNLERLYVEGESANIHGGNFWVSHFQPAGYYVRRCVDERVKADMFSDA